MLLFVTVGIANRKVIGECAVILKWSREQTSVDASVVTESRTQVEEKFRARNSFKELQVRLDGWGKQPLENLGPPSCRPGNCLRGRSRPAKLFLYENLLGKQC